MGSWHNNRPSYGKRVSGRTRRCRNDESVSLIGRQRLAINRSIDGNHRGIVAFQDGHVVQCTVVALQLLTFCFHLNDSTRIDSIILIMQGVDGMFYLLRIDVSKEAQPSCIDAKDGNLFLSYHTGSAQKSSVASHRNGKVSLKLVVVKDVNPFQ